MLEYAHDMVVIGNHGPDNCISFCIDIFKGSIWKEMIELSSNGNYKTLQILIKLNRLINIRLLSSSIFACN
ncbi:MAG TPA: hypothetical protein EYG49_04360 [Gammaproteobacteria bacterium]|jgi:hypothetical protein|nr:hypothetical protein [Gammaproteobacteria bacterium]